MKFYAIVSNKYTNQAFQVISTESKEITSQYHTKKELKKDLIANGYTIKNSYIYTEEEWNNPQKFEAICQKFHDKREIRQYVRREFRKYNRRTNKLMDREEK